jgi:Putative transposase
LVDPRVWNKE